MSRFPVYSLCPTSILAANAISHLLGNLDVELRDKIAEIVDRETHGTAVLEMLKKLADAYAIAIRHNPSSEETYMLLEARGLLVTMGVKP